MLKTWLNICNNFIEKLPYNSYLVEIFIIEPHPLKKQ